MKNKQLRLLPVRMRHAVRSAAGFTSVFITQAFIGSEAFAGLTHSELSVWVWTFL